MMVTYTPKPSLPEAESTSDISVLESSLKLFNLEERGIARGENIEAFYLAMGLDICTPDDDL